MLIITKIIIGEQMEYLGVDSVDKSETLGSCHFRSLTTEFLNSLTTYGLPNHSIKLKSLKGHGDCEGDIDILGI